LAEAENIPRKLTAEDAFAILEMTLRGGSNYGGVDDATSPRSQPFFLFQGIGRYSATIGWWAVNPWTGDMWTVWFCDDEKRLDSPFLLKARAMFKRRFSQEELKQYERLRELKPGCLES
jgi:hypothetical protein